MIEAGVNVRIESRSLYNKQIKAKSHKNYQDEQEGGIIIGLKFFGKIFYALLVCLTCSLFAYLIEVFFNRMI